MTAGPYAVSWTEWALIAGAAVLASPLVTLVVFGIQRWLRRRRG